MLTIRFEVVRIQMLTIFSALVTGTEAPVKELES